ncbi:MAG: hypothetical protein NT027_08860 [Proteobacteria bacterium]|nr:hypothetical protein [Pseudomonadota bacterium]
MKLWNFLCLLLSIHSGHLFASKNSEMVVLRPIEIDEGQHENGSVELHCNERLDGLVIRESKNTVVVAAAISRSNILCSTAPVEHNISLKIVSNLGKAIVGLPSNSQELRLSFSEVVVSYDHQGMQVSWDETCKPFIGVLLKPQGATLAITVALGQKVSSTQSKDCSFGRRSTRLSSLNIDAYEVESLRRPSRVEDLFEVTFHQVQQIVKRRDGSYSVLWNQGCRQKPIGVLFAGKNSRNIVLVAATLPNIECGTDEAQPQQYLLPSFVVVDEILNLELANAKQVSELNRQARNIYFEMPRRVGFSVEHDTLNVAVETSCRVSLGVVMGSDSAQNIALSHLQVDEKYGVCNKKLNSQLKRLPIGLASSNQKPRFFPLKVKGSISR